MKTAAPQTGKQGGGWWFSVVRQTGLLCRPVNGLCFYLRGRNLPGSVPQVTILSGAPSAGLYGVPMYQVYPVIGYAILYADDSAAAPVPAREQRGRPSAVLKYVIPDSR